jgi:hypothetical protein
MESVSALSAQQSKLMVNMHLDMPKQKLECTGWYVSHHLTVESAGILHLLLWL